MSGLDLFLIAFSLLSAFLAMIRGFTREVFTLIAWLGAIALSLSYLYNYQGLLTPYIGTNKYAHLGAAGAVFVIVLISLTIISMYVSNKLFDSKMGVLESSLGFVFGLARGLVVVAILYVFFSSLVPVKDHPQWITQARSLSLIQGTGQSLISLLPDEPYEGISELLDSILKPKATDKDKNDLSQQGLQQQLDDANKLQRTAQNEPRYETSEEVR